MNDRVPQAKSQVLSIGQLKHALSPQRLQAYATEGDTSDLDAVGRYFWNAALVSALMPEIHLLEVSFRNHLFGATKRTLAGSATPGPSGTWLDATPDLLEPVGRKEVDQAKLRLTEEGRQVNEGRLIAKLGLGFWVGLCHRPYEASGGPLASLWPQVLRKGGGFPNLTTNRVRITIHSEVEEIRRNRNRISHHEPIWDRDVLGLHDRIAKVLGWIGSGLPALLEATSHVRTTYEGGYEPYRELAARLVILPVPTDN